MKDYYIKADEISSILDRKICTGYKIIRELNAELQAKGYRTVQARVPREYFYERYGISERWEVIDLRAIDDFLGAIWYATLIGLEYIKMAWCKWQNI